MAHAEAEAETSRAARAKAEEEHDHPTALIRPPDCPNPTPLRKLRLGPRRQGRQIAALEHRTGHRDHRGWPCQALAAPVSSSTHWKRLGRILNWRRRGEVRELAEKAQQLESGREDVRQSHRRGRRVLGWRPRVGLEGGAGWQMAGASRSGRERSNTSEGSRGLRLRPKRSR